MLLMLLVALCRGIDHLRAGLLADVPQPLQSLAGVVGPQAHLLAIGEVAAVGIDERYDGLHAAGSRLVDDDGVAGVALGHCRGLLLKQRHLRAGLVGRDGGGHARGAGADDHDIVIAGVGDVGDGLGLHEECRGSVPGCCGGLPGGGYRLLGCAAPEHGHAHGARGGHAAELEQVSARNSAHNSLLGVSKGAPRFGAPVSALSIPADSSTIEGCECLRASTVAGIRGPNCVTCLPKPFYNPLI